MIIVSYCLLPALLLFVSVGAVRTVLCETTGLHFPPSSDRPRSTAYEPIPLTAEQTPEQVGEMVMCLFCNVTLLLFMIKSQRTATEQSKRICEREKSKSDSWYQLLKCEYPLLSVYTTVNIFGVQLENLNDN